MDQPPPSSTNTLNAYAQALANELGWDVSKFDILKIAVNLHDIGKICIRDEILHKPGPLTKKEWKIMKTHPVIGAQMVAHPLISPLVSPIIRAHHENWDGSGYPDELQGEEIPEEARLLAVVNAFDVMTTDQPYRPTIAVNDAFEEIMKNSGSQFDPIMVEAFRRCWDRGEIKGILNDKH